MQNLIIYENNTLYYILEELSLDLNFNIIFVDNENTLNQKLKDLDNYLIISNKKLLNINNLFILKHTPINISIFCEKINIEFLKIKFNRQSNLIIKNYTMNLNSREIATDNNIKLKLTEKEIHIIVYLSEAIKPVKIDELKIIVWGYNSNMETHTVETHIYRLRKKFSDTFKDSSFIISKKEGYKIN
jgi:hypothetical protein